MEDCKPPLYLTLKEGTLVHLLSIKNILLVFHSDG